MLRPYSGPQPRRPIGIVRFRSAIAANSIGTAKTSRGALAVHARIEEFEQEDILVERSLGAIGVLDLPSYRVASESTDDRDDLEAQIEGLTALGGQQVSAQNIQVPLYAGRVARGKLRGTRVVLKAYPCGEPGGQSDVLAANELATHCDLQPPTVSQECDELYELLGSLQTSDGEKWLVFRNDGVTTAAAYAAEAAKSTSERVRIGPSDVWDAMDPRRSLWGRQAFVLKMLRQGMKGLAFMHSNSRLHQSIGPDSLVLNTVEELRISELRARLRDMAFAVDISDEELFGGPTLGEIWDGQKKRAEDPRSKLADNLWSRARAAGATWEPDRRNFGIADDVYAYGLLLAYMAFVPFCEPGTADGPALQRLLEGTFQSRVAEFREYCVEDERYGLAVAFLDLGNGAGWDLLGAMLNPEWKLRPTAESCLNHPFLGETFLRDLTL